MGKRMQDGHTWSTKQEGGLTAAPRSMTRDAVAQPRAAEGCCCEAVRRPDASVRCEQALRAIGSKHGQQTAPLSWERLAIHTYSFSRKKWIRCSHHRERVHNARADRGTCGRPRDEPGRARVARPAAAAAKHVCKHCSAAHSAKGCLARGPARAVALQKCAWYDACEVCGVHGDVDKKDVPDLGKRADGRGTH